MYQLLLKDGTKIGQYSPNAGPSKTAEKMAKQIYIEQEMKGKQKLRFQFVKNRVKADGGDKLYDFEAVVTPLPRSRENFIETPHGGFYKRFDIRVTNLMRN